jgi:hypothetical protein
VIVAADVLEHLKDPLATLRSLRPYLDPDGYFVISVPNVAHGSVRMALLTGHFDYREIGLLDSTHLRFFTRESFECLLDEAELGLAALHRHELNLDASEVSFDADALPAALREKLESEPDARTYQFVVKAIPMPQEGLREIQARLHELVRLRAAAARTEELEARTEELEQRLAEIGGREGELRRSLIEAHDQLLRRDTLIDELSQEALRRDEEIVRVHGQLHETRVGLARLWESPLGRVYQFLRSLKGLVTRRPSR